ISTVAGNGTASFCGDGGQATQACLSSPEGVALDSSGTLYIADAGNYRIRKVSTSGVISTVAGSGIWGFCGDGGQATLACLSSPTGVALDSSGTLYIADYYNQRIRKVSPSGVISTVAGGTYGFCGDGGQATQACLRNPEGVALDSSGTLYIADSGNYRIRAVERAGSAAPAILTLTASPEAVNATPGSGNASVISALATDAFGNPLAGVMVGFAISRDESGLGLRTPLGPSLSASSAVTAESGYARITYTAGYLPGTDEVTATAGWLTARVPVEVRPAV
ncbi:MAG: hypothetical protein HY775_09810, partial [Acidobacteria bacterium]|nr:hypothetical protein [Acidobacteriota bacterium]